MFDVLNEKFEHPLKSRLSLHSCGKCPRSVYWMKSRLTAVVPLKKCPKRLSLHWYWNWRSAPKYTEIQYVDSSLAQWKHRDNTCCPDVTSVCLMYWMKVVLTIPWKVDYLFTAVVLFVPHKCILNFSTSIQVLHNESSTPVAPMWLRYVWCIEWK